MHEFRYKKIDDDNTDNLINKINKLKIRNLIKI